MSSLHRRAIERPIRTLAIAAVLVIAAGLGVLRLEIRTDGRAPAAVAGEIARALADAEHA